MCVHVSCDSSPVWGLTELFEEKENVNYKLWPLQSPDLSLIKQLWKILECRVKQRSPPLPDRFLHYFSRAKETCWVCLAIHHWDTYCSSNIMLPFYYYPYWTVLFQLSCMWPPVCFGPWPWTSDKILYENVLPLPPACYTAKDVVKFQGNKQKFAKTTQIQYSCCLATSCHRTQNSIICLLSKNLNIIIFAVAN